MEISYAKASEIKNLRIVSGRICAICDICGRLERPADFSEHADIRVPKGFVASAKLSVVIQFFLAIL